MKRAKEFLAFLVCLSGISIGLYYLNKRQAPAFYTTDFAAQKSAITSEEHEAYDEPLEALKQEFDKTRDPKLNIVPTQRLLAAYEQLKQQAHYKTNAAIPSVSWKERGPNNQGGRTRAIWVDLNDATRKTLWIGSVGGGLWKTTDITAASPNWTIADDLFGNLAITSITQDPGTPAVMYFCTGEGYSNIDAIRGLGVWKSSNGGTTWAQLSSTNNSSFYYCHKVFCTSTGILFVCTTTGLYRSTNGGTSFTKVLGSGISGSAANNCWDIEMAANGDMFASMGSPLGSNGTIHKSFSTGATWNSPLTLPVTSLGRMEMAAAPSDANYLYVMVEKSYTVSNILKTTNGGTSFTSITKPVDADGGIPATDIARGQAWYNLTVAVDPNNREIVYVGGIDLFRTLNGGTSWQQVSHWYGGFGYQNVHADQHNIFYSPGSSTNCYFSNDGGIYSSSNANAATPVLARKDAGYRTTQFYACAIHPTASSNYFLAGSQDNGSHSFSSIGINATSQVTGGDGAFCHIDINNGNNQLTSYVRNNIYYSTNGGSSFSSYADGSGSFINPSDLDGINDILYSSRSGNQVLRWASVFSGSPVKTTLSFTGMSGAVASHIKVSPNTPTTIYVGTTNGQVLRITNANAVTPTATSINSGLPIANVSCIEIEKGNENHILIVYSNYGVNSVYETTNGGTSWVSQEGNLPDMPVRWCIFNPSNNDQAILATEIGVWTTDNLNGTSTNWGASNTGLANVRVDMIKVRASDSIVIAATHGRGLYSTDAFTSVKSNFTTASRVVYPGTAVNFTDLSTRATAWAWDFDNNSTTDASTQNPTYTYNTPGYYTVKLTVNGTISSTIINYIHVMPYMGIPYLPANGGNFDNVATAAHFDGDAITGGRNIWERGAPGNTLTTLSSTPNCWKTLLTANVTAGNYSCALYSPSFNMTAAGTYTLSFKGSMNLVFCNAPFAAQMQYSLNHGTTWNRLGINGSGTNWYSSYPTSSGCVISSTVYSDRYGWNANYNNATMSYDISSLQGNNKVCFRLVFRVVDGYLASAYAADGFMIDDFQITGPSNAPVPVEWLSFTATKQQADVLLKWATAQEEDNAGFEIQRSPDTKHWEKLGFVKGAGNTINTQQYSYEDKEAFANHNNTWYYRLKQQDYNGQYAYSETRAVSAKSDNKPIAKIYPNPTHHTIRIDWNQNTNPGYYVVLDMHGKTISEGQTGETNTSIELSQVNPGLYLLVIYNDKHELIQTEKIYKN